MSETMTADRAVPAGDPCRPIAPALGFAYAVGRTAEHVFGRNLLMLKPLRRSFDSLTGRVDALLMADLRAQGPGRIVPVQAVGDEAAALPANRLLPWVIRGKAKAWKCSSRWSFEHLANLCGEVPVHLVKDHITEERPITRRITIKEVVDSFGGEESFYARFVPILHRHPDLLQDLDVAWCSSIIDRKGRIRLWGRKGPGTPIRSHLFLGQAGKITKTHCELTSNLFINVAGRKRWHLVPARFLPALRSPVTRNPGVFGTRYNPKLPHDPDFPMMDYADRYEVTMEAGDVLYVPPFFWHHVETLSDNISIGIRWYNPRDAARSSFLLNFLTLIATNPSLPRAIRNAVEYADVHG